MAALNAEWRGTPRPTDVLAFALPDPHTLAGDIYICPGIAAREARIHGVSLGRELLRLVVHGVLHVLGWDHPEGPERIASPMWRRQERYLKGLR
jgi:probable rRNA maturation factor